MYDNQLKFDKQTELVRDKANKACNILKFLNGVSWGMETNTALQIYKSYIRSVMNYGLFVYFPKDWRGKEKIEKLQYKGIRIALGYRNSTTTNVMLSEAKVMRMEERAGLLARNFWTKLYRVSHNLRTILCYRVLEVK